MSSEFTPANALYQTLRYWWFVVIMMILGALVGWGLHALRPSIYETTAAFSISLDFAHTGRLSDIEQDQALGIVGDIISSPDVMDLVIRRAQVEGITIDLPTLKQVSFMERKFYVWTLRIRHENPQTAVRLGEIWVDAAQLEMDNAIMHAIIADSLHQQVAVQKSCIEIVVYEPANAYCNLGNLATIEAQVKAISEQIYFEQIAGKGMLSGISYVISARPALPSKPITYGLNQFMLIGSILGFILSWWGISLELPGRFSHRLQQN